MQLSEQEKMLNAQIIEKMNEGLYNIYYNCYFSKYTSRLAPLWINTEEIFNKIKQAKQSTKQTNAKQAKEIMIAETEISICDTFVKECEQPKSASTIESHNDKES